MQRHSYYLAKYLAAAGHRVDLYHTRSKEGGADANELALFSEQEKKQIRNFVFDFPEMGKMTGHYIRESYEYSRKIWNVFKQQPRADFVYVKGFSGWELLSQKKKGASVPPVGLNFHGYEMFQPAASFTEWLKYALLLRSPVKFCVRNADYLFSYGGKIDDVIGSLGVEKKKIISIPTGIEPKWINGEVKMPESTVRFVFVGRYERRKGIQELNEVLKKTPFAGSPSFEFSFIGPVPDAKKLRKPHIIYHGRETNSEKIAERLRASDILVCPSHSEGMPNVILEAMASGCAIIATDVGAVSLMVGADNGWLIPPGNTAALETAMRQALGLDASALHELKKKSVSKAGDFLWEKIITQTVAAIEKVVERSGP